MLTFLLTIHALTLAVGLPANIFTFLTLLTKTRCHHPHPHLTAADLLLLHLTAADLLVLLFLPFKMAEAASDMAWPFPIVLCPIANFCFYSSIYLSTLFMAALSVERYFGVVFPHRYNRRRRRLWRTMAASAVLWGMALSHCSIVFVAEYHRDQGGNGSRRDGERGFGANGIETGETGMDNPNGTDPIGLEMDKSRCFGVGGFDLGGFGMAKPNATDDVPSTSTAGITIPSGSKTPSLNTYWLSSPETNLNISPVKFSACTTPNTPHIPTTTPWTSRNASKTQPPQDYHCYDDFSQAQLHFVLPLRLELFLVLFLLPFAVTVFCYIRLIRALLIRPHIPPRKKNRTVGLAVATLVNFGVCFGPYNLSHVVGFVQQSSPKWRPYALLLTTLSAALDPFIFYFSSSAVRRAVSGVVGAVWGKMCGFWGWCWQRE